MIETERVASADYLYASRKHNHELNTSSFFGGVFLHFYDAIALFVALVAL